MAIVQERMGDSQCKENVSEIVNNISWIKHSNNPYHTKDHPRNYDFNDSEISEFLVSKLFENEYAGSVKDLSLHHNTVNFIYNGPEHIFPTGFSSFI